VITPVATSQSHSSGDVEEEACLAWKTWHPQVEQKYHVEVEDVA
jgi:hypothetical protein